MGWRFILTGLALGLGVPAMRFIFDLLQLSEAATESMEVVYLIVLLPFMAVWAVLTFKTLVGGRRTAR